MANTNRSKEITLLCPSNSEGVANFYAEPCKAQACSNFENGKCTAAADTAESYREHFGGANAMLTCPVSATCRWNLEARHLGDAGCAPRMLGMICEHQPGGEWNTFEMEPPDSIVWHPNFNPETGKVDVLPQKFLETLA